MSQAAQNLPRSRPGLMADPGRFYAGIGSRETPENMLDLMERLARRLAEQGWVLRSGGASGADTAFGRGAPVGMRQLFLPWPRFNGRSAQQPDCLMPADPDAAMKIAAEHHPAWHRLSDPARRLMARNACQVLGERLDAPSRFVVCWAKNPERDQSGRIRDVAGGTGLAVRIAYSRGIDVIHLADHSHLARIERFLDPTSGASTPRPGLGHNASLS